MSRGAPSGLRWRVRVPPECVGPFLHVRVRLTTHDEAGGVFCWFLRTAALPARALLRRLAPFLARAFTSLMRLRCPAALRSARPILLLLAITPVYAATYGGLRWMGMSSGNTELRLTGILPPQLNVHMQRSHVRAQSGAVRVVAGEIMGALMQLATRGRSAATISVEASYVRYGTERLMRSR